MRSTRTSQQDGFADSMSKFSEAARHSMTASRLAIAGTAALGAATYFYFANPERRQAAANSANRMFDSMRRWWKAPSSREAKAGGMKASPGATGVA